MANVLTGIRIICGLLILVFPAFSGWYYLFYLLGGITDAVDGTVARKLGLESDFGSKFDTAADFIFAVSVFAKIVCSLYIPVWLIICIAVIAALKLFNVIAGYIKYKKIVTVHSLLNKICGAAVFLVALFVGTDFAWQARFSGIILCCALAFAAAIAECSAILKSGDK